MGSIAQLLGRLIMWGGAALVVDEAGQAIEATGDAAEKSTKLVKYAVIGGGLYVAYKVAKSSGALK